MLNLKRGRLWSHQVIDMADRTPIPKKDQSAAAVRPARTIDQDETGSITGVLIHSFVVIPFLIAIVCVLSFTSFRILVAEKKDAFQLLDDIRNGDSAKRWRAAFELSTLLSEGNASPDTVTERFCAAMVSTFEYAKHDPDPLVRQYLALAMGRSGRPEYAAPLLQALEDDPNANLPYIVHGLGLLADPSASPAIQSFAQHRDVKVRLQAVIALGNLADESSKEALMHALDDPESNVRWDAAVALAKMGDPAGKRVLLQLLDRGYLSAFKEVDREEEVRILLTAIAASAMLHDSGLHEALQDLAENDPNMQVRRAAIGSLQKRTEGHS